MDRPLSFFIPTGLASGYLNQPEVMAAIHVKDPGFCWAVCNTAPTWKYTVSAYCGVHLCWHVV
jgi:hypothetical protein